MATRLELEILPQPDDVTCGPTCLHAVYRYFGDHVPLEQLTREVPQLEGGGTLAVLIACHALRRGYTATIYTYNLQVFDPTWFQPGGPLLSERLRDQLTWKGTQQPKLHTATEAYVQFLRDGGQIRFEDLTRGLIRRYLRRHIPILTGLSATNLYRCPREIPETMTYDDLRGEPTGHFVVLCGYDKRRRSVLVADPLLPNPISRGHQYSVSIDRVICSIMLGIITYDANLLILEPPRRARRTAGDRLPQRPAGNGLGGFRQPGGV